MYRAVTGWATGLVAAVRVLWRCVEDREAKGLSYIRMSMLQASRQRGGPSRNRFSYSRAVLAYGSKPVLLLAHTPLECPRSTTYKTLTSYLVI